MAERNSRPRLSFELGPARWAVPDPGQLQDDNGIPPTAAALSSYPFFAGLSPDSLAEIHASAKVEEYLRGDALYFQGDLVRKVFLILFGMVKVTKLGASGCATMLRMSMPGDFLGI